MSDEPVVLPNMQLMTPEQRMEWLEQRHAQDERERTELDAKIKTRQRSMDQTFDALAKGRDAAIATRDKHAERLNYLENAIEKQRKEAEILKNESIKKAVDKAVALEKAEAESLKKQLAKANAERKAEIAKKDAEIARLSKIVAQAEAEAEEVRMKHSFGQTAYEATFFFSNKDRPKGWSDLSQEEELVWHSIGNHVAERCANICEKTAVAWPEAQEALDETVAAIRERQKAAA